MISCCNQYRLCMHIESVHLSDGNYELVPANTATPESASVNFIELNQDLGQSLEEPQASGAQEDKPGAFDPIFLSIHSM